MRAVHLHSDQGVNTTTPSRFFTPPPQPPPLRRTATLPDAVQTCAPPSFVHYLTARAAAPVPAFGVGTLPPSLPTAPPASVNAHVLCPPLATVRGRFTACTPSAPARLLHPPPPRSPSTSLSPVHPNTTNTTTTCPRFMSSIGACPWAWPRLERRNGWPNGLGRREARNGEPSGTKNKKRSDDGRLVSTIPSFGSGVWGGRACTGIMALLARVGGTGGG